MFGSISCLSLDLGIQPGPTGAGPTMSIKNSKWDVYLADVVGNVPNRDKSRFDLTIDDLNVIELGYDCAMSPSSVALLLRGLGHTQFAGVLPSASKQREYV
jgi:hypothetical protein